MTADDGGETLRLLPSADASSAFAAWSRSLTQCLADCRVVEVGSTGVPGLPTKGDLDVAVVAPDAVTWSNAVARLRQHLEPHDPEHWSATWASFRGVSDAGDAGVQVVLAGSDEDALLCGFRALLLHDAAVVARYAALKADHDGRSMRDYRAAKGRFVERELRAQDRPH